MSTLIYLPLIAGIAVGLFLRKLGVKRYVETLISLLVYGLVFLVGLNSGRVSDLILSSSHSIYTLLKIAAIVTFLAALPAFLSIVTATLLLGEQNE